MLASRIEALLWMEQQHIKLMLVLLLLLFLLPCGRLIGCIIIDTLGSFAETPIRMGHVFREVTWTTYER